MAKKLIGHMACPECGFSDAEVGEDKNGHPYRHCPDCNAQYFTRGDPGRIAKLKEKMRPVKTGEPAQDLPATPKKRGALDGLFDPK